MITNLEQRLEAVETERNSRDAMAAYCWAIDHHDAEALRNVFSSNATLSSGEQQYRGIDAVIAMLAGHFPTREWARHYLSNIVVSAGSDGPSLRCYFQYTLAAGAERTRGTGTYQAKLSKIGERLVITQLDVALDP